MRTVAVFLLALLFNVSAAAQNCPPLLELVDEMLAIANELGLSERVRREVLELRGEAVVHRDAGDDRQCVLTVDKALALIERG